MWEFWRSSSIREGGSAIPEAHVSPFERCASGVSRDGATGRTSPSSTAVSPMPPQPSVQSDPGSPHIASNSSQHAPFLAGSSSVGSSVHKAISKRLAGVVHFRDVQFVTKEVEEQEGPGDQSGISHEYTRMLTGVQKNKLIIILVGLPGRGKTFLCNKLMRYLNWLGHNTRHFNVGQYRRKQKGQDEVQDASFFDYHNEAGLEARNRALNAALDDMCQWLETDQAQVAIFDATNSTEQRRQLLRQRFHGRWQYLLIESICNDDEVLATNYLNKMKYSPDYTAFDMAQALADFKQRIKKYEEVYETVTDRTFHYIKLIDMVTGRGHMDINRISGYIPGKIVFFLMQVCKAGLGSTRKLWLTRHGQSEYNKGGRLGGDSSISEKGEKYAELLPGALLSRLPTSEPVSLSVWTSTLVRTIQTARHLPFPKLQWKALDEIDAGICDGMTYEEIASEMPEEFAARKQDKLRYRYPSGESYLDLIQRTEPVITEMERERECVLIVSHQAVLRVLYGYFMGVPPEKIPSLEIPLHTLIELTPMPDGTMQEARVRVDTERGEEQFALGPVEEEEPRMVEHRRTPSQQTLTQLQQVVGPSPSSSPQTIGLHMRTPSNTAAAAAPSQATIAGLAARTSQSGVGSEQAKGVSARVSLSDLAGPGPAGSVPAVKSHAVELESDAAVDVLLAA